MSLNDAMNRGQECISPLNYSMSIFGRRNNECHCGNKFDEFKPFDGVVGLELELELRGGQRIGVLFGNSLTTTG